MVFTKSAAINHANDWFGSVPNISSLFLYFYHTGSIGSPEREDLASLYVTSRTYMRPESQQAYGRLIRRIKNPNNVEKGFLANS